MKIDCSKYKTKRFVIAMLLMTALVVGCSAPPHGRSSKEEWVRMTTLVDGQIEIQVSFPHPAKSQKTANNAWSTKMQFVQSEPDRLVDLVNFGYDPGAGKMDGAMWVYMYASVIRIDRVEGNDLPLDFEQMMQTISLAYPKKSGEVEIVGRVFVGKEEWYGVNTAGQSYSHSVMYYKPIADNYAIQLSMNMFGEESITSNLFQQRHQDLLKAMASVKVTVADFAKENE